MENLIEKYYKQEIKKIIDKSSEILEEEQYKRVIEYLIGYLSSQLEPLVIPKIAEEKLMLNWQEAKLIDGTPAYILDDSHGVSIDNYIDRIEIKFYERVKEGGKYYCRTTKKHVIDAKKVKEDFEALNE